MCCHKSHKDSFDTLGVYASSLLVFCQHLLHFKSCYQVPFSRLLFLELYKKVEFLVTEVISYTVMSNSQLQKIFRFVFSGLALFLQGMLMVYMLAFVFQFQLYIILTIEETILVT